MRYSGGGGEAEFCLKAHNSVCVGISSIFSILFTESQQRKNPVFLSLKLKEILSTKYKKNQKKLGIAS